MWRIHDEQVCRSPSNERDLNKTLRLYTPLSAENERKRGGRYSFTSSTPPKTLFDAVIAALSERGYNVVTLLPTKMLIKAALLTPKVLKLCVQLF